MTCTTSSLEASIDSQEVREQQQQLQKEDDNDTATQQQQQQHEQCHKYASISKSTAAAAAVAATITASSHTKNNSNKHDKPPCKPRHHRRTIIDPSVLSYQPRVLYSPQPSFSTSAASSILSHQEQELVMVAVAVAAAPVAVATAEADTTPNPPCRKLSREGVRGGARKPHSQQPSSLQRQHRRKQSYDGYEGDKSDHNDNHKEQERRRRRSDEFRTTTATAAAPPPAHHHNHHHHHGQRFFSWNCTTNTASQSKWDDHENDDYMLQLQPWNTAARAMSLTAIDSPPRIVLPSYLRSPTRSGEKQKVNTNTNVPKLLAASNIEAITSAAVTQISSVEEQQQPSTTAEQSGAVTTVTYATTTTMDGSFEKKKHHTTTIETETLLLHHHDNCCKASSSSLDATTLASRTASAATLQTCSLTSHSSCSDCFNNSSSSNNNNPSTSCTAIFTSMERLNEDVEKEEEEEEADSICNSSVIEEELEEEKVELASLSDETREQVDANNNNDNKSHTINRASNALYEATRVTDEITNSNNTKSNHFPLHPPPPPPAYHFLCSAENAFLDSSRQLSPTPPQDKSSKFIQLSPFLVGGIATATSNDNNSSKHCTLRGAQETWESIYVRDFYLPIECSVCKEELCCIRNVGYVWCPACRSLTSTERVIQQQQEQLNRYNKNSNQITKKKQNLHKQQGGSSSHHSTAPASTNNKKNDALLPLSSPSPEPGSTLDHPAVSGAAATEISNAAPTTAARVEETSSHRSNKNDGSDRSSTRRQEDSIGIGFTLEDLRIWELREKRGRDAADAIALSNNQQLEDNHWYEGGNSGGCNMADHLGNSISNSSYMTEDNDIQDEGDDFTLSLSHYSSLANTGGGGGVATTTITSGSEGSDSATAAANVNAAAFFSTYLPTSRAA